MQISWSSTGHYNAEFWHGLCPTQLISNMLALSAEKGMESNKEQRNPSIHRTSISCSIQMPQKVAPNPTLQSVLQLNSKHRRSENSLEVLSVALHSFRGERDWQHYPNSSTYCIGKSSQCHCPGSFASHFFKQILGPGPNKEQQVNVTFSSTPMEGLLKTMLITFPVWVHLPVVLLSLSRRDGTSSQHVALT